MQEFDVLSTNGLVKHPFLPKMHLARPAARIPHYNGQLASTLMISLDTFATLELGGQQKIHMALKLVNPKPTKSII